MAMSTFPGFLVLIAVSSGQVMRYGKPEQYVGPDFFQYWNFYTGPDPTHGTVDFVSEWEGWQNKLLDASEAGVLMRVDNTTVVGGQGGRKAVRIESKNSYNGGLFVVTLENVPTACGAWPAFWMFGDDAQHAWPRWGEYDILESIHMTNYATTTLHTRRSCDQRDVNLGIDFVGQGWATGSLGTNKAKNCWVKAPQEFSNQGCGQKLPDGSFGPEFNKNGGGTFVAEWTHGGRNGKIMRTWFFPKGKEPIDLVVRSPQPDLWGTPNSFFTLNERWCSADHFKNMRMVFDTTFCGDYAGSTFQASCPWLKQSCEDYVRNSPGAFSNAFWNIKRLDVYQKIDAAVLAAQAPQFVADTDAAMAKADERATNNGPVLAFFFLALLSTSSGVLYYYYHRNQTVKAKVDELAVAAKLPEAYNFTMNSIERAKNSVKATLQRQGCMESENESPMSSPTSRMGLRRGGSREFKGPASPAGSRAGTAAAPMTATLSMGHQPSLRSTPQLASIQGRSPTASRVQSGSLPSSAQSASMARGAQPDAHQVPQPYIFSMMRGTSGNLSGPLPQPVSPQPTGMRQNSLPMAHQASSGSQRMQAMAVVPAQIAPIHLPPVTVTYSGPRQ